MFGGPMGGFLSAVRQKRAANAEARIQEAETQIREAMADRRALNELQSIYRDWCKPPRFRKIGGQWFAEVEYPPSVPRVKRSNQR